MSYDCDIYADLGGSTLSHVEEIGNMTWNVGGMFQAAFKACGRDIRLGKLSGESCGALTPFLKAAYAWLVALENVEAMKALEPSNGWGSYDGAVRYLRRIIEACERHPKGVLVVS